MIRCGDLQRAKQSKIQKEIRTSVFLEGPYYNGKMIPSLNKKIPLIQPYSKLPWNYSGHESAKSLLDNCVN